MCIKLIRIHECENEDHMVQWLVRCSTPIDLSTGEASDQWCLMLPTEVHEYYDEPCGNCTGDFQGPPSIFANCTTRVVFEPWKNAPADIGDTDPDRAILMNEELLSSGGPSFQYARKLASFLYYLMTQDMDSEFLTLPDYIATDPACSAQENKRNIWWERYREMLPEICCRFNPDHGSLYGVTTAWNEEEETDELAWGIRQDCVCLSESNPYLNNALLHVRRSTVLEMLEKLVFNVNEQDHEYLARLHSEQELLLAEMRGLGNVFRKRAPEVQQGLQVIKPMNFAELQAQINQLLQHIKPKMDNYCNDVINRTAEWIKGMDESTYQLEARTCRERQHLIEKLVVHLLARDPGLTADRRKHVLNCFYNYFFRYNSKINNCDIELNSDDYFFRLAHVAMRDILAQTTNWRQWIDFAAWGSNGVQMHTLYQESLHHWNSFYKKHLRYFTYIESMLVDATDEDIARMDEGDRLCAICGDDLKALLDTQPRTAQNKRYLRPAQGRTCWEERNNHWHCKSCLIRHAMTNAYSGEQFPKARCPLCRKHFDPAEQRREMLEKEEAREAAEEARTLRGG